MSLITIFEEFRDPTGQEYATPALPEPTLLIEQAGEDMVSLDEHTALCETAYQRGVDAGRERAMAELDASRGAALTQIAESLNDAQMQREEQLTHLREEFADAFAAIVASLAPGLVKQDFPARVREYVSQTLSQGPRTVELRVNADDFEAISGELGSLETIGNISIDSSLAPLQAAFEWPGASAMIDSSGLVREILELAGATDSVPQPAPETDSFPEPDMTEVSDDE